jgi:hypothetical protein
LELPNAPKRAMKNLLRPYGTASLCRQELPSDVVSKGLIIPRHDVDLMPCQLWSWIQTHEGYRRLQADELYHGLGGPKSWCARDDRGRVRTGAVA